MAYIDYKTEMKERSGEFDCFCDKVYHDDGYSAMKDYTFDLDPEKEPRCHEWWHQYWKIQFTIKIIPGII